MFKVGDIVTVRSEYNDGSFGRYKIVKKSQLSSEIDNYYIAANYERSDYIFLEKELEMVLFKSNSLSRILFTKERLVNEIKPQ